MSMIHHSGLVFVGLRNGALNIYRRSVRYWKTLQEFSIWCLASFFNLIIKENVEEQEQSLQLRYLVLNQMFKCWKNEKENTNFVELNFVACLFHNEKVH